jgi:hypothetical protein
MGKAENLAERLRTTLEAVDQMKRDRDRAVIAGKPYDLAALARLEAEVEAIESAQVEQVRQERIAAHAEYSGQLAALRGKMRKAEERRLEAVADAEAAAQQFADAVNAALDETAKLNALHKDITGRGNTNLVAIEFVDRMADLLMLKLHPITRRVECGNTFGRRMSLHEHPHYTAKTDWVAAETKQGALALMHALEEK